jgi:3-oxosteroid 1-dehydrogenase
MSLDWDSVVDWLVIGSGGGGMTAALVAHDLAARVLIVEKGTKFGGSTGMSGGALWVPMNEHLARAGIADSRDEALAYLRRVAGDRVPEERVAAYVDNAKEMVRYLEEKTRVRFAACQAYPDYYPEYPGGKPGARTIEPLPYGARKLGAHAPELQRSAQGLVLGRMGLTAVEAKTLVQFSFLSYLLMFWILIRYWLDVRARLAGKADNRLTLGTSLVARLRHSLLDRDVPIWLGAPAQELLVESGRVVGAVVKRGERVLRIRAERGVLLASGGFERNLAMRQQYQRAPVSDVWTAGNPNNQGDGIRMGQAVGAAVDLMHDAWWTPVTMIPPDFAWLLVVEKSMPGSILVNRAGRRFTNEAAPYVDVVNGMYSANDPSTPSIPAYLVFDARYRRSYPVGPLGPSKLQPDSAIGGRLKKAGFLKKSGTLSGLAEKIGVDPKGLAEAVERFNAQARAGQDTDFHRGESLYDRYYSDAKIRPNSCLAPIQEAPFYAIEVFPGDLGTKGGLVTDVHGRVLDERGVPIAGLYATGNCSASVMGNSYPGAGGTIGPAMTFGYLAARHAIGAKQVGSKKALATAAE